MRRCLKKWLAFSLCGWHNHLGWQGANTKAVTRGIHFTTWDYFQIVAKNAVETLCQTEGATQSAKDHVAKACECPKGSVIPLGLWPDATRWIGTAVNFWIDFDQPTWPSQRLWIYIMEVIPQECSPRGDIQWEIFEVFARSFQQLFVGKMPCQRHDGKPFSATQCSVFKTHIFVLASWCVFKCCG